MDSRDFEEAMRLISEIIDAALKISPANIVILDCHGTRETLSYAAAALSDHAILVSTTEKITFLGTLRFMEGLDQRIGVRQRKPALHLVYNAVSDGIREPTLSNWYSQYFSRFFSDENFLAAIPSEAKISIATSDVLFPTKKYRYSMMAEKVRILVSDLFRGDDQLQTTKEARFIAKSLGGIFRPAKPLFSIIVDERIPLRALFVITFLGVLGVIGYFHAKDVLFPVFLVEFLFEPDKQLMLLSIFLFFGLMFTWVVLAFACRFAIDQDSLTCGEVTAGKAINLGKLIWHGALVLSFGSVLVTMFPRSFLITYQAHPVSQSARIVPSSLKIGSRRWHAIGFSFRRATA